VLAMIVGGVFGLMMLVGLTHPAGAPAVQPARSGPPAQPSATSSCWCCCMAQLLAGLSSIFVSYDHIDGNQMIKLGEWAQHIVTFRGRRSGLHRRRALDLQAPMCSLG
jgi:nitrate reductase gamma subunit